MTVERRKTCDRSMRAGSREKLMTENHMVDVCQVVWRRADAGGEQSWAMEVEASPASMHGYAKGFWTLTKIDFWNGIHLCHA